MAKAQEIELSIQHITLDKVVPNPWNPNRQNERQFEAEVESIADNGFIAPILVRKLGMRYEIIDGEHRWKALRKIAEDGIEGKGNIPSLVESLTIPAIVLTVDETQAKKLTIIMNETRGRADIGELTKLLQDLATNLGDDLLTGLPYTQSQLEELMNMGGDALDEINKSMDESEQEAPEGFKIIAVLNEEDEARWKTYMATLRADLPQERQAQAGALIAHLMNKAGIY
jgi:ParB-like chromosome segregation protein Spo0J